MSKLHGDSVNRGLQEPYGKPTGWTFISPGFTPDQKQQPGSYLDRIAAERVTPKPSPLQSQVPGWVASDAFSRSSAAATGAPLNDASHIQVAGKPLSSETSHTLVPRGHHVTRFEQEMYDPDAASGDKTTRGQTQPERTRHHLHHSPRNVIAEQQLPFPRPESSPKQSSPTSVPPWAAWPAASTQSGDANTLPSSSTDPHLANATSGAWGMNIQLAQPAHSFGNAGQEQPYIVTHIYQSR